jgi:nickel-dependent lactate racemase
MVRVPWGSWHGDVARELPVPARWHLEQMRMTGGPRLERAGIEHALDTPIGAPPIEDLAHGVTTAAIAIDDLTRPTPTAALLQAVVDRLARAGLPESNITVVVASGAHRRATARDLDLKVGPALLQRVRVVPHDPAGDLVETGVTLAGCAIRLNRAFMDADLRIGIGGVAPHPFAGYSGGGKVVIPGLADLDVLTRTHKYALMGLRGGSALAGNRFRSDMEDAVRAIGLHWTVNVVVNETRQAAFVAAGDLVAAHRAAAEAAARVGATPVPSAPLDALLLNAYPKDAELLQVEAAFVALRGGSLEWVQPNAPIVLIGACPEGIGTHGLFGPGGRLYRTPSRRTFLGERRLWTFAPTVDAAMASSVFWNEYPHYSDWEALTSDLDRVLPPSPRVGILPCGPLQVLA